MPSRSPRCSARTRARSCSRAPGCRPTAGSPTTAGPTAPAGSRRCSTASSSVPARPAAGTGPARSSAGSASRTPSRTPPTAPSPTCSGGASSARSSPRTSTACTRRRAAAHVTELHGSLAEVVCLTCGDRSDRDLLQARMADANPGFERLAAGRPRTARASAARSGPTATSSSPTSSSPGSTCRGASGCGGRHAQARRRLLRRLGPARTGRRLLRAHRRGSGPARARVLARGHVGPAVRAARGEARHPGHGGHPRADARRRPHDPAGRRLAGAHPRRVLVRFASAA